MLQPGSLLRLLRGVLLLLLLCMHSVWRRCPVGRRRFRVLSTMAGNQVTTEQVWRQFRERLTAFIHRRLGRTADTEDLLQEVFLRIHKNLDSLRERERLEAWVFQITRNVLIDWYKRKENSVQASAVEVVDRASDDAQESLNAMVAGCVTQMIDLLPQRYQDAVRMYDLEGLSQKQIADRMGLSLSGAKSRVQRGRRRLESVLRECCQFQWDRRGNVIDYVPTDERTCGPRHCAPDGE